MFKLIINLIITIFASQAFGNTCDVTTLPDLPDVTINEFVEKEAPVPHFMAAGVIGTEIKFELLLPKKWNGKFVMGGGGGFVGDVQNMALFLGALQSGYATVGTDTGHQGNGLDGSWALNNLERIVNFGHQAIHRTAVTAKALIRAFYEKEIQRNYFVGCSTGGRQALMSAQRYPMDFEGIVSGAPAYNWSGLAAQGIQIQQHMFPDQGNLEQAVVTQADQDLLEAAIMKQCDAMDGIEDEILNDPRECDFDVTSLSCEQGKADACLNANKLKAIQSIYDGQNGDLFHGYPFGGESAKSGWSRWLTGGMVGGLTSLSDGRPPPQIPNLSYGFSTNIMKYFIYQDADWNYQNFDISTYRKDSEVIAATVNATNPDLSSFRDRNGKLLMYHGWSDSALTALGTVNYYEQVLAQDQQAMDFTRLFMMPGVLHCRNGKGPSLVNFLDELDQWVESGDAPDQITAYFMDAERKPSGSRILCPYPQKAEYDGHGDPQKGSSFSCSE